MTLAVVKVDSVRQAVAMLAAEPGARFLAGGTLLVRDVNEGDVAIDRLVLSDGLGMDTIEVSGGRATIGAAVVMARMAAHRELDFLRPVAESIGGPAIRNMATVGGNLFAPSPYGDFAVALLALGATATIETLDGTETVDLESLLSGNGRRASGIVRAVAFDLPTPGAFRFAKIIRRHPRGASVLSIAAVLPLAGGKVSGARIGYGAMAPTPIRARAVEQALEGKVLNADAIAAAQKVAVAGADPTSDAQASDWYRLNVLPVHLGRLLSAAGAA
jgi:xanthine dehydrogenase small subunit